MSARSKLANCDQIWTDNLHICPRIFTILRDIVLSLGAARWNSPISSANFSPFWRLRSKGIKEMFERDRFFFRSLRGPLLVSGILLTSLVPPALAADGAATPVSQAAAAAPKPGQVDPLEARIRDLHDKLKVTDAQAGQWEGVAHAMRSNAKEIETLVHEKRKTEDTMTAIEDLRAYQEIAAAHAKAAEKLADAFDVLYQTMPDDQKKLADAVFREHKKHAMAAHK